MRFSNSLPRTGKQKIKINIYATTRTMLYYYIAISYYVSPRCGLTVYSNNFAIRALRLTNGVQSDRVNKYWQSVRKNRILPVGGAHIFIIFRTSERAVFILKHYKLYIFRARNSVWKTVFFFFPVVKCGS